MIQQLHYHIYPREAEIYFHLKNFKQMFIAASFKIDQTGNNLAVFQWVEN